VAAMTVRSQYRAGAVNGQAVPGYPDELGGSSEDIQVDRDRGIAYLSFLDRDKVYRGGGENGSIVLLDLNLADPAPRAVMSFDPANFRPHGLSLLKREGQPARLFAVSGLRIQQLRDHSCAPDQYLVPGTRAILEDLRARGLSLYLASGTDDAHLKEEADLLGVTHYFDGGVHGALPDPEAFSKRILMERILRLPGMRPYYLIGFGDGPVEIEELKRAGGLAVGLATDEPECRETSPWKRRNLIEVGADYIIPNYLCRQVLLPMLFANHEPI